ncbi:MAG TPA: caspase family protein [Vicinamibacterales bacterium]|nr:caspase family protein [Vicinamibacterales bacterium]
MKKAAICLLVILAVLRSSAAQLPNGVTSRVVSDGVVLFQRSTAPQPVPGFFAQWFDLFGFRADARAALPFGRSVALLVGIGHYKNISPSFAYIQSDVTHMRDYLLSVGGFDDVYVMSEAVKPTAVDSFMQDFLARQLGKEDRLLFYFSGHGADNNGFPFLQFQDAKPGVFTQDVLRVDQYEIWSKAIGAKHVLFLFDACYAGLAQKKDGSEELRASVAELSGNGSRTVVTAGTAQQRAWVESVSEQEQSSVFTAALLDALRSGAADKWNRGFVTIDQAVDDAAVRVSDRLRKLAPGEHQMPSPTHPDPALRGTFVFLNPKAKNPGVPTGDSSFMGKLIPKDASSADGYAALIDKQMEMKYWDAIVDSKDPKDFLIFCQQFPAGQLCPAARRKAQSLQPSPANGAAPNSGPVKPGEIITAADRGSREAKNELGRMYESGTNGVAIDTQRAIAAFEEAVRLGDGDAAFHLAAMYQQGRKGLLPDGKRAAAWYQTAADLGDARGLSGLGYMYQYGRGVEKNLTLAVRLYQEAAGKNDIRGVSGLAFMYERGDGGLPKDPAKAAELYQRAVDAGDARAMNNLGAAYSRGGLGFPKDDAKAAELYKRAVDLGHPRAMANLGVMYRDGSGGLPKDPKLALELFQNSADLNDESGLFHLGWAYDHGLGPLEPSPEKSVELYERAADLGLAIASNNLGGLYEQGRGAPKDLQKAVLLYQRAVNAGSEYAKVNLGRMYENGLGGLSKDQKKAIELYQAAAKSDDSAAATYANQQLTRLGVKKN